MNSNFKSIINTLKPVYTTKQDDLVNDFYIPVLSRAISYDRVTGFFSSTALSVAARGLSKFLLNPNSKMRMIVSCKGFEETDKIEKIYDTEEEVISEFNRVFKEDIDALENMIIKKRIAALAWLLKTGRLEIKVAKMTPLQFEQGILHSKFGILTDNEDIKVCFSGSINESKYGWKINGEVISVYKSTVGGHHEFIGRYIKEFEDYWNNNVPGTIVLDLPEAIKQKLIKYSCEDVEEVIDYIDPEIKTISSKKLRYYQEEAILSWLKNNKCGFFEMATGTGKTLVAVYAIKKVIERNPKLGIIIAVPTNPLLAQWRNELINEGFKDSHIICCSSDYPSTWKKTFRRYTLLETEQNMLFIFTYQSLCRKEIQNIIDSSRRDFIVVCDEMHHTGAPEFSNCLNKKIKYRMGLSATPIRARDIEGNQFLMDYFGDKPLLIFDIGRALKEIDPLTDPPKTYLCPYNYYFETVELSPTEHEEYKKLSRKIAQQIARQKSKVQRKEDTKQKNYVRIEEEKSQPDKLRALLISCACEKIELLDTLIKKIKKANKHKKMLFYCQSFTAKDIGEKQIDSVKRCLDKNNLNYLEFTYNFDDPEFRKYILNSLRTDAVDAIVSIKCLDEGIDMPDIRTAVILASSSNSAQFIQRRGRILRNSPGKERAELYDFLVGPPMDVKLKDSDISLIKREFDRAMEYAKYSLTYIESYKKIIKWVESYGLLEGDLND